MEKILDKVNTMEEAQDMAKEIELTESALKQMKKHLKTFVEENGTVNTGEKVWQIQESHSWKITDMKKLIQGMTLEGIDPWNKISISKKELDNLGWNDEILQDYGGEIKVSTRFSGKKI